MQGYYFDFKQFVRDLGGGAKCYRRLRDVGVHIAPRTIYKWIERDNIDVLYLVNLMAHRAMHEGPIDLNKYIVRETAPGGVILPRDQRLRRAPESGPQSPAETSR